MDPAEALYAIRQMSLLEENPEAFTKEAIKSIERDFEAAKQFPVAFAVAMFKHCKDTYSSMDGE